MIVKRKGRLPLLVAAAMLAVFALAGNAHADPTATIGAGSGNTSGSGSVDPINVSGESGDTSVGLSTGSGSGNSAQAGATSGDSSGSITVGCVDATAASGSTAAGGQLGSCGSSSAASGGAAHGQVASGGAPVPGDTTGSAHVGCIRAAGGSGSTAASGAVGSCRGGNGAVLGSAGSGDSAASAGVGCIVAAATGDASGAARVGACPQTHEESPSGPAAPGPGGSTDGDGLGGGGGVPGSDVLGANAPDDGGILATLTSGELPLTGLPLLPVLLAAVAALVLAIAIQRRRARQLSRA